MDTLEARLQRSLRNREVLELLKYEKSLVYFETALQSNELMMERLQRSRMSQMFPEDEDLLEDVLTENQQAIQMVGIANNILSQMMDAFASIISNVRSAVGFWDCVVFIAFYQCDDGHCFLATRLVVIKECTG